MVRDDRRKSPRISCRGAAKIHLGVGGLPRDCTVIDVSEGGLRMIAEHLAEIPPTFTVVLADGKARDCRLAWRIGCEFGAEFVARDRLGTQRAA